MGRKTDVQWVGNDFACCMQAALEEGEVLPSDSSMLLDDDIIDISSEPADDIAPMNSSAGRGNKVGCCHHLKHLKFCVNKLMCKTWSANGMLFDWQQ